MANTFAEFLERKKGHAYTSKQTGHSDSKNSQGGNKELVKEERVWEKDERSLREDETRQQQRGGEHPLRVNVREIGKSEPEKEEKKEDVKENIKVQMEEPDRITERRTTAQQYLEHDMRDQALGQMYAIPGANVDYDEINKMAKNRIRDVDELVLESLKNDGLRPIQEIREIERIMEDYLEGKNLTAINGLNEKYDMESIARAYVNVAERSLVRDITKLERISETCHFECEAYERVFDHLQAQEPRIKKILDRLDMEMGIERS